MSTAMQIGHVRDLNERMLSSPAHERAIAAGDYVAAQKINDRWYAWLARVAGE